MSDDTIEVPTEQLCDHLLAHACENDIKWECVDEVREDIDVTELADPRNVTRVEAGEDGIRIVAELSKTVSEKVRSATRWQPAEYRNHDVTVYVEATLSWPEDPGEYTLALDGDVLVTQAEHPTQPPTPDV